MASSGTGFGGKDPKERTSVYDAKGKAYHIPGSVRGVPNSRRIRPFNSQSFRIGGATGPFNRSKRKRSR